VTATYTARILSRINEVSEVEWDAHLPAGKHPFLSWRFFNACEESGSAIEETGWAPRHIWLEDENA
jgi:predicted N-acyltransferase